MSQAENFETINEAKANLDHIYNEHDPRPYFEELGGLGYRIPDEAKPVFQRLIAAMAERREGHGQHLLDLGCSYGVNAALLKYDLSMAELKAHWDAEPREALSPEALIAHDRAYFETLRNGRNLQVSGLDVAENAVHYAEEVGLLKHGLTYNLEEQPLPADAKANLETVDLITSTGCVGYLSEKTFEQLLPTVAEGHKPWIANFVLRCFPFDAIEGTLAEWGYVTEKLEGRSFIQRRFADKGERDHMLAQLAARGIDPAGKEANGYLHAEFYLSRPEADAKSRPLAELIN